MHKSTRCDPRPVFVGGTTCRRPSDTRHQADRSLLHASALLQVRPCVTLRHGGSGKLNFARRESALCFLAFVLGTWTPSDNARKSASVQRFCFTGNVH